VSRKSEGRPEGKTRKRRNKMIETKENEKKLMALIKCPVSAIYFAEIVQGLSTIAKSEGRTAFMRQTGDHMEIYSVLDKPQSRTQNDN
jgi:hypothetical protein